MNAVYKHTAKTDADASQELAADSREIVTASKRDSSSMKGIAILTMVFLPGTYIATFLATPFFNFDTSQNTLVARPHFWIYWAITVPLTAVVLLVCLTYAIWTGQQHRSEDKVAREGTSRKRASVGRSAPAPAPQETWEEHYSRHAKPDGSRRPRPQGRSSVRYST